MENESYEKSKLEAHAAAEPRKERVRKLRAAGLTWAEIGKLLGVTRARAHQLGKETRR